MFVWEFNGMNILVLNPGSSSLKFRLYQMPDLSQASATRDSAAVLVSGIIEPIGGPQATLTMCAATQKPGGETVEAKTPAQAVEKRIPRLPPYKGETPSAAMTIDAVGCR